MNLKESELKKLYQRAIKTSQVTDDECPSDEKLVASFMADMEEHEKFELVDHISKCRSCFSKFELIKQIWNEAKVKLQDLDQVSLSIKEVNKLKAIAKTKLTELEKQFQDQQKMKRKINKGKIVFFPKLYYKYLALAASFAVVVGLMLSIFKSPDLPDQILLRGPETESIQLITPCGKVKSTSLEFKWKSELKAIEYEVVLLDEELTKIWSSGTLSTTETTLPSQIFQEMAHDTLYYWKVIFTLKSGEIRESDLNTFELIP